MGWLFRKDLTRKELIAERSKSWESDIRAKQMFNQSAWLTAFVEADSAVFFGPYGNVASLKMAKMLNHGSAGSLAT